MSTRRTSKKSMLGLRLFLMIALLLWASSDGFFPPSLLDFCAYKSIAMICGISAQLRSMKVKSYPLGIGQVPFEIHFLSPVHFVKAKSIALFFPTDLKLDRPYILLIKDAYKFYLLFNSFFQNQSYAILASCIYVF